VGLQRRHENQYKETVKRIQDGAIGDFSFSRVYWNSGGVWVRPRKAGQTEMEYQMRNWYYFNWLCGDHISEQHIHNLDVSNWIKDAHPIRANAMGGREVRDDKETGEIFDHFFVEYEYADGTRMFSQCRHIKKCWNSVSEAVHGTSGTSDVNRSIIRPAEGKGDAWRFSGKRQAGHQQEWHDLFKSLHAGERPVEAEYGATSTMTAILGRMAAYSGQVVNWDDALKSGSIMPETLAWDAAPRSKPGADGHYPSPKPGITKPY
jgi:predicted dehydrogenase